MSSIKRHSLGKSVDVPLTSLLISQGFMMVLYLALLRPNVNFPPVFINFLVFVKETLFICLNIQKNEF